MLDIDFIRENKKQVVEELRIRNLKADVNRLLALDESRRILIRDQESVRAEKNTFSKQIATFSADQKKEALTRMKEIDIHERETSEKLTQVMGEFHQLMNQIPNIHLDDVPVGKDESENVVIRTVGEKPQFDFTPIEHWKLGEALDVIDMARAAKVTGARFAYLKGSLALMEFALVQFVLSILTDEKKLSAIISSSNLSLPSTPFVPLVPPIFIKSSTLDRMARLEPREERYHLPEDDLYLIGSAEHTIGSYHMDETLHEGDLPIRYVAFSPALRREAGSYGKDMKGILRLHQFDKIEMESFATREHALDEQNLFVAIQEYIMQELDIPYQVMMICTGDMGKPDARQIDLNAWLPGQDKYRETHTADFMTDYQARRLKTKVKRESGKTEFVHMNDGTAVAIGRTLISIMENYQTKDGAIRIPQVLQPYMHGMTTIDSNKHVQKKARK